MYLKVDCVAFIFVIFFPLQVKNVFDMFEVDMFRKLQTMMTLSFTLFTVPEDLVVVEYQILRRIRLIWNIDFDPHEITSLNAFDNPLLEFNMMFIYIIV